MLAFLEGNELLVVLLIVLVLFGGSKLPQLARSLGQAQREFARGRKDDEPSAPSPATAPTESAPAVPPPVKAVKDETHERGERR